MFSMKSMNYYYSICYLSIVLPLIWLMSQPTYLMIVIMYTVNYIKLWHTQFSGGTGNREEHESTDTGYIIPAVFVIGNIGCHI